MFYHIRLIHYGSSDNHYGSWIIASRHGGSHSPWAHPQQTVHVRTCCPHAWMIRLARVAWSPLRFTSTRGKPPALPQTVSGPSPWISYTCTERDTDEYKTVILPGHGNHRVRSARHVFRSLPAGADAAIPERCPQCHQSMCESVLLGKPQGCMPGGSGKTILSALWVVRSSCMIFL